MLILKTEKIVGTNTSKFFKNCSNYHATFYLLVSEVADYESYVSFLKFKMADFVENCSNWPKTFYLCVFEVADYKNEIRLKNV